MTILLTSASRRRKALLQQIGFQEFTDFQAATVPLDFPYHKSEDSLTLAQVKEKVVQVARLKIKQAVEGGTLPAQDLHAEQTVVVGIETIWFLNGRVLARPLAADPLETAPEEIEQAKVTARQMLRVIRGTELTVLTGLVVAQGDEPARQRATLSATRVTMKAYGDKDIEAYIASGEGLTMAGGIDLQGQGIVLCERIKGSYSNIGGLPLVELVELLRHPLFAGRVQFRLSEPDKGRYSIAVKEGPPRLKVISLDDRALVFSESWPDLELADVLHVPGRYLVDGSDRERTLRLSERAKEGGKLVVLDFPPDLEGRREQQDFLGLLHNKVDVLLAGEISADGLAKLMAPRILLASQSPRRRELLKQIVATNQVEVLVSQQDEPTLAEKPGVRVKRLALEKARAVFQRKNEYSPSIKIVIGADTEVAYEGEALGKPAGPEGARQQLRRLQGRTHQVITGLALISTQDGREFVDSVTTLVKFKELTKAEIETYVASGEPFGKAGAYGIQSKGALFVEEINGSYSNVVGLPLERLSEIMDKEFGLPVWQLDAVSGRGLAQ